MTILNALLKSTAAAAVVALGFAAAPTAGAQGLSRPSTEGLKPGQPGEPSYSPAPAATPVPSGGPSIRNLKSSSLEISHIQPGVAAITEAKFLIVGTTFTIVNGVKRELVAVATAVDAEGKPILKKDGSPLQATSAIRPTIYTQGDGRRLAIPLDEIAAALGDTKQFRIAVNVYDTAAATWLSNPSLDVNVDLEKLQKPRGKARPGPAGDDIVGNWTVAAPKQLFDLKITSITGNRIWYTTTLDGKPRLGMYIRETGSIEFTHTDRDGVERDYAGHIRVEQNGMAITGISQLANGGARKAILSGEVFGATFSK